MERRIVITGLGLVTALGHEVKTVWQQLLNGQDATSDLEKPVPILRRRQIIRNARIKNFDLKELEPVLAKQEKLLRSARKATQFALVAGLRAARDAGLVKPTETSLDLSQVDPLRTAVYIGLSMGDGPAYFDQVATYVDPQQGPTKIKMLTVPEIMPNGPAAHVSIMLGAKRTAQCLTTACSTGTDNIGHGYWLIKLNKADTVIAGGCDDLAHEFYLACFGNLGALSLRGISCPFSKERDGFVMGEGAGIVVLEEYEHAKARGANLYAELVGYDTTADAFHITAPPDDHEGGQRVVRGALAEAGLQPEDVHYINAHGTSTEVNDKTETALIRNVFGKHAYELPISSTKSMLGHCIGAAGAIEAVVCCLTVKNGQIHPTINYTIPDPECDLDYCVAGSRQTKVEVAGSISLGFGGHNSFLLFKIL
ncbi:MAG: beta-ketoacyl-[acyl-carrier-protein] synthase family protein [Patescibacteria group bacterium]